MTEKRRGRGGGGGGRLVNATVNTAAEWGNKTRSVRKEGKKGDRHSRNGAGKEAHFHPYSQSQLGTLNKSVGREGEKRFKERPRE